ncbi:Uncharacterized protein APZ42_031973 [Daphnia magna]|uniref:Uncharacterized protein n=1 Tax=Daphnia magna TaxID=35525 RepID=A0A164MFA3_9CRUS|nr:Uncharacterized protein APZ42_031973 [Daphnia magna]
MFNSPGGNNTVTLFFFSYPEWNGIRGAGGAYMAMFYGRIDGSSVPLFRYTTSLRVLWAPSAHGLLSDVIGPDWLRYAQMVLVFKAQPMQKLCT